MARKANKKVKRSAELKSDIMYNNQNYYPGPGHGQQRNRQRNFKPYSFIEPRNPYPRGGGVRRRKSKPIQNFPTTYDYDSKDIEDVDAINHYVPEDYESDEKTSEGINPYNRVTVRSTTRVELETERSKIPSIGGGGGDSNESGVNKQ
ncbi:hypothetical protein BLA29_012854, partial [Euroglyphus maynei]